MPYTISDECILCGACIDTCPTSSITKGDKKCLIDPKTCIDCGACAGVCPVEAPKPQA